MNLTTPTTHLSRAIYWTLAALIILLGVYLSTIRFLGAEWLSRAGCLVVMLGIWCSVGGIVQERLVFSRIRWRRRNAKIRARARFAEQQVDTEQAAQELAEIDEAFDKLLADTTQELRLSLGILEVSLLLTGTFLWGFGDLFVM